MGISEKHGVSNRRRRTLALEELEPRLLLSAAGALDATGTARVQASVQAIAADVFEPNESSDTSRAIQTNTTYANLSIHVSGDNDWFSFDLPSNGTASDKIRIEYDSSQGELSLALSISPGVYRYADPGPGYQEVLLTGIAAGTHRFIVQGKGSQTNPNYSLRISVGQAAPDDDQYEDNDSLAQAAAASSGAQSSPNLGTITCPVLLSSLKLSDGEDWFRFVVNPGDAAAVRVTYSTWMALGLEVYDAQGAFASGGDDVETPSGDMERVVKLAAGEWYARVHGAANPSAIYSFEVLPPVVTPFHAPAHVNPSAPTWVVIHGKGDSSDGVGIQRLAEALTPSNPIDYSRQVLVVDWSGLAHSDYLSDFSGEGFIPAAASMIARQLESMGFTGAKAGNLNLVGHSWGGVMTALIAANLDADVARIIALDPAVDAPSSEFSTNSVDFAAHSQYALAFRSSVWGSGISPSTADDAIFLTLVGAPFFPGFTAHEEAVEFFTDQLLLNASGNAGSVSQLFALESLGQSSVRPWLDKDLDASLKARKQLVGGEYLWVPLALYGFDPKPGAPASPLCDSGRAPASLETFTSSLSAWGEQTRFVYGDDGSGQNGIAEGTEGSDAVLAQEIALPADASSLDFDYHFPHQGNGDRLVVSMNGQELWSVTGTEYEGEYLTPSGPVDVSAFAGQTVTLEFRLASVAPGSGDDQAQVWLDNVSLTSTESTAHVNDAVLSGRYNFVGFFHDKVNDLEEPEAWTTAGYATFDGAGLCTLYAEQRSIPTAKPPVTATYSVDGDGRIEFDGGRIAGGVTQDGDLIVVAKWNSAPEYGGDIGLIVFAKSSTTLSASSLSGRYNIATMWHDGIHNADYEGPDNEFQTQRGYGTFDGAGHFSGVIEDDSDGDPAEYATGTYSVDGLGRVLMDGADPGIITPDGNLIVYADVTPVEGHVDVGLVFLVKASSGLTRTSVAGSYEGMAMSHWNGYDDPDEEANTYVGDLAFDGVGQGTSYPGRTSDDDPWSSSQFTYGAPDQYGWADVGQSKHMMISPNASVLIVSDIHEEDDGLETTIAVRSWDSVSSNTVLLGQGGAKSLTYTDADGTTATVKLSGPGTATVAFNGIGVETLVTKKGVSVTGTNLSIAEIALGNTSAKSALAFSAKGGDALIAVGGVVGSSSLKTLSGKVVDLTGGGIALTGTGFVESVTLHDTRNGADIRMSGAGLGKGVTLKANALGDGTDVQLTAGLKSLTALQWVGGVLNAPWAGKIDVKGDCGADVQLTGQDSKGMSLGALTVGGTLQGFDLACPGGIRTLTAGRWNDGSLTAPYIATLNVKGSRFLLADMIGVAVNLTGQDAKGLSLGTAKVAGSIQESDVILAHSAKSVAVGLWSAGSTLAVAVDPGASGWFSEDESGQGGVLGSLTIGSYTTTGASPFGIVADAIARVSLNGATVTTPVNQGQFRVWVV